MYRYDLIIAKLAQFRPKQAALVDATALNGKNNSNMAAAQTNDAHSISPKAR
jgi:hypothetical protein